MKRAAKKPRVTLRTGTSVDKASAGGPYVSRYVLARIGTIRHSQKNEPAGNGIEVHLEEWAPERNSPNLYLSVRVQRPGHGDWLDATDLTPAHFDALFELLTLVRDKGRESGILEAAR